ncbi:MAG: phosphodiester glycosidase family protein, partial [Pedobacter sp.]
MVKTIKVFLLLTGLTISAFAQSSDSLTFVKTKWQKTKVAAHVRLFRHHFNEKNLFAANQNIFYVEVKNKGRRAVFAFDAEEKELVTTSDFGKRDSALVAINGNFFDVKNGGSVDFVRVNGKVINENRLEKEGKRAFHQQAAVVIEDGKLNIIKWDGTKDWETKLPGQNILLN